MHKRAVWSAVVACSMLAGCASLHPEPPRQSRRLDCDGSKACTVTINVACERFYGCTLSADYDLVLVAGRGRNVDIEWVLAGEPGAEFASNGIVLDSSELACKAKPDKRQFGCSDKHSDFGVFKYRVNVTVPGSAFGPRGAPVLDPWIVNN
jgi:hypothetical protein